MQETLQHLLETKPSTVSRIEVLQGPTGRRKWPDQLKARIVAESYLPGARVVDVAERHGVLPQYVTTWRRMAREGLLELPEATASFVPLRIEEAPAAPSRAASARARDEPIEIEADGVIVRLSADATTARIGEIVAVLRRS